MKKILSLVCISNVLLADTLVISPDNQIGSMIDASPYSNKPQNQIINKSLKTQKSPLDMQKSNENNNTTNSKKDLSIEEQEIESIQKEEKANPDKNKRYITLHIDDEGLTFEKLKIDQEKIKEALSEFDDEPLSIRYLQDLANIVAYYCQANNYPSATAYIPPQNLQGGKIQINIAFGVLGKYIVKNESGVRDYAIESKLNQKLKGKLITTRNIEDTVYKVNEMYGIKTLANLQAGDGYNESDVVIEVQKGDSATLLLYADNYGSKETGYYHAGMSQTINNLARQGDSLNLYLQNSNENQINYGVNYSTFLGNIKISPFISQGNYTLGGKYSGLGFYGSSFNTGVNFSYPVFINTKYSFYLISGLTQKKLKDYFLDGIVDSQKASIVGNLGVQGTYKGIENNAFSYSFNVFYGDVRDDDSSAPLQGPNLGKFAKMNLNLNNEYYFNETFSHIFKLNYQKVVGGAALDSSEQISLGGPYGVRAYTEGDGTADNAVSGTLAIRMQTPLKGFYISPFYDIGYSWFQNKQYQAINNYFMDATGLELLYLKPGRFYLKLDAARALHKFKFDEDHRSRVYVSTGLYF